MGRPYGPAAWRNGQALGEALADLGRPSLESTSPQLFGYSDIALRASEEHHRYTVALSPLIPWIADSNGKIIEIDERGLDSTGLTYETCSGFGFMNVIHPADREIVRAAWHTARNTGRQLDYEIRLRHRDGRYRWHRSRAAPRPESVDNITLWYGTIEDIDDRKTADEAIRWTADHDDLTSLWNRRAFMQGLHRALAMAAGTDVKVAVVLIDLDGLKLLNDRYGHDVGDALLTTISSRLAEECKTPSMAGRLGGDEFALFLHANNNDQFEQTIASLRYALAKPCALNGQAHSPRASMGVAFYPDHGKDADLLYKNADLALYEAKAAGGGGIRYFENVMRASLQARLSELSIARYALDNNRVLPFYQPKVDLLSGSITGFEALLRWHDAKECVQSPLMISASLDDAQLAIALDDRMFDRVAADISEWTSQGLEFGRIAFNVSAAAFRQENFAENMLTKIREAGISPKSLELEVTEKVLLGRATDSIASTFCQLREAGVTIALDDFGTGYASLIHLKQFPVDVLKIDCSFVQALGNKCNAAIVRAIVNLGKDIGVTSVAEGVESREQAKRLHGKGCDQAQGYLYSPAVPASKVPYLLAQIKPSWGCGDRRSGADRRNS